MPVKTSPTRRPSNSQKVTLGGHGYDLGDVNHDEKLSIDDVTSLISYLLSGDEKDACPICADVDADGKIGIDDVTVLINLLLGGN